MTRKLKVLGMTFAVFLVLALPVNSLEFVDLVHVDESSFRTMERVDLGVVLVNDGSSSIDVLVEQYLMIPGSDPLPLYEEISIDADGDEMITDMSFDVSDYTMPGTYTHLVRVYDAGTDEILIDISKIFYIDGTLSKFTDPDVVVCADSECNDLGTVFSLGETAYIKVESSETPGVTGYTDNPSGDSSQLSFSGGVAEFSADSEGTYTAMVILYKSGYENEVFEKDITFVGEVNRPTSYFCGEAEDSICDKECEIEDPDCKGLSIPLDSSGLAIFAVIILVAVVVFILFFRKK